MIINIRNHMQFLSFFKCFVILFLIGLSSCNNNKEIIGDLPQIKVCLTKDMTTNVYASDFISGIEYVILETTSQSLISNPTMSISDNYILVMGSPCMLFSRQGKFIRHIGGIGQGPGEYSNVTEIDIDEKSDMIYLSNYFDLLAYRISGEFVKKLNLVEFHKRNGYQASYRTIHWKDDLFCANIDINSGKELYSFVVFTLDGEVVKLFPNYVTFDKDERTTFSNYYFATTYRYNGIVNNKRDNSDTLFRLTDQLDLVPDVYFDLCGRPIPKKLNKDNYTAYTHVREFLEVENYILFKCDFGELTPSDLPEKQFCIYDRNSTNLTFCKIDPLAKLPPPLDLSMISPTATRRITSNNSYSGLINDIDGGLPFWPSYFMKIQSKQKLACAYQPSVMLGNLTEEYFSAHEIKDIQAHERLKKLLENLEEDDNPVLMIATFK